MVALGVIWLEKCALESVRKCIWRLIMYKGKIATFLIINIAKLQNRPE